MERNRGPMNKNRIRGAGNRDEWASDHEVPVTKGTRRKFGGRAVTVSVLTRGDLALRRKGRSRGRTMGEREVSRGHSSSGGYRDEGLNRRESDSVVPLEGARPQMSRQLELPLGGRGEAPMIPRREEAPMAGHGEEHSGTHDGLGVPRLVTFTQPSEPPGADPHGGGVRGVLREKPEAPIPILYFT